MSEGHIYVPRKYRKQITPFHIRVLNFLFWTSVIATPLTLWVFVAWAISALEVVR